MATHKSLVIHNILEETVLKIVDEISDGDTAHETPKYCTTDECRMDAACYVLNRIPQRYVSSARGQAHTDLEIGHDQQLFVDIVTLAHEGLRRVSSVKRSFYGDGASNVPLVTGPHFYLPTIKGRFFNGESFQPIVDVPVYLMMNDAPVAMLDSRWPNPYEIVGNAAGTYLFWPTPIRAEHDDITQIFEFEIRVEHVGYESFHHFFSLERTSTAQIPDALEVTGEHRLPDLYLLPRA